MNRLECCEILGINEKDANDEKVVKSAYRKLAFKYHPDKNPGHEKEAEEKFKKLNEAYSALTNGKTTQEDIFHNDTRYTGPFNPWGKSPFAPNQAFTDFVDSILKNDYNFTYNYGTKTFLTCPDCGDEIMLNVDMNEVSLKYDDKTTRQSLNYKINATGECIGCHKQFIINHINIKENIANGKT